MTPEEIKKLEAENAKLKAANEKLTEDVAQERAEKERIGDEAAKKLNQLREDIAAGRTNKVETPGEITVSMKPPSGGNKKKFKLSIADGHPTIRLSGKTIVSSAALMKVAQGQELTEDELKVNPGLEGWDKAKAVEFLSKNAAIKAGWLNVE